MGAVGPGEGRTLFVIIWYLEGLCVCMNKPKLRLHISGYYFRECQVYDHACRWAGGWAGWRKS